MMEEQKIRINHYGTQTIPTDTIPSFLLKTYEILECQKYYDIICWTKNGQGFIVKKVKQFADNVLPIYFRHSNYTSFVRQLNMYDFHKTRQENHQNAFKNLMFKRGYKHLLKDIQRKDYKKNKENAKQSAPVIERIKQVPKQQKKYEIANDITRNNFNQTIQLANLLQNKALILAQIRTISTEKQQLLKLIDILFDSKKIYKEMTSKMEQLAFHLTPNSQNTIELPQEFCSFISGTYLQSQHDVKGVKNNIPTCATIFPSLNINLS